mmetsp:Transcript_64430/g.162165  ORF Transcript_64430/g.162165 Transcript_64430/m.162165 type:complete len:362 (-) Transcript_64430:209-1294(-)
MAEEEPRGLLGFTIVRENTPDGNSAPKRFTLQLGAETPIRIGRAPGNDIIVESRGVSQYHAELRMLQQDGEVSPKLHVRDLSMNGTGLKRAGGMPPVQLDKRADVHVPDGSQLLVPMLLKVNQQPSDRAWLKVEYLADSEVAAAGSAPPPRSNGKAQKSRAAAEASKAAPGESEGSDASNDAVGTGNGNASRGEDTEKNRMRFVELLLKTKEVSAGTTYEDAEKLLSSTADWDAVDESTRRECFDIFVEHLGSHGGGKKKDKKKGKEKGKDKSKKSKREDDSVAAGGGAASKAASREVKKHRGDRRGDRSSNDASHEGRKRRRGEKRGSRRSRSRGGRSGSPAGSPAPRDKRRRRGRSGSP